MFASAAEFYRRHPFGNTSPDDPDDDDQDENDSSPGDDVIAAAPALPAETTVRLSGAMFLEDALDRLREALTEKPVVTTHRLRCTNLGLDGLVFDEDELHKTLLARLLHSRNWKSIELHDCRRIGVLLDLLVMGQSKVHTLSVTGGHSLSWIDVQSLAKAIPHTELNTLHLFMTLPKPQAPLSIVELMAQKTQGEGNDDNSDCSNDDDDNVDSGDEGNSSSKPQDPSLAMKLLISGMQVSLKSLELCLSRRNVDTLAASLRCITPMQSMPSSTTNIPFGMLQRLDLRHSFLADANVAQIVDSIVPLVMNSGQLRALDLRGNCECQSLTLQALMQPSTVSLKDLWVSHTVLTEDRTDGLQDLLASLSTQGTLVSSLESLDLGNYMITNADMERLLSSLTQPASTLMNLNLLTCGMTSIGVALWEEALPLMNSLRRLAIPADASYSLQQGLVANTSLETLELGEREGVGAGRRLARPHDLWLDLNRGGRQLLMTRELVPAGLWPLILERAQTAQVASKYYGGPSQSMTVLWYLLQNRVLLEQ